MFIQKCAAWKTIAPDIYIFLLIMTKNINGKISRLIISANIYKIGKLSHTHAYVKDASGP